MTWATLVGSDGPAKAKIDLIAHSNEWDKEHRRLGLAPAGIIFGFSRHCIGCEYGDRRPARRKPYLSGWVEAVDDINSIASYDGNHRFFIVRLPERPVVPLQ